jgi:hypothetical protein
MGQYGPTCPGIHGMDGNNGNVFSVTYGPSMRDQSSIPTSRPNSSNGVFPPLLVFPSSSPSKIRNQSPQNIRGFHQAVIVGPQRPGVCIIKPR